MKKIKSQILQDDDSEHYAILKSINEKYKTYAKPVNKLIPIIFGSLFALFFVLEVALFPDTPEPGFLLGIAMILFFALALYTSLTYNIRQHKFVRKSTFKIEYIKRHELSAQGLTEKEIVNKAKPFTNSHDALKFLTYCYPNENLRKKAIRVSTITSLLSVFTGVVIGLLIASETFSSINPLIKLIFLIGFVVSITLISWISSLFTEKITKKTNTTFEREPRKKHLLLKLHELLKKTGTLNNKVAFICFPIIYSLATLGFLGGLETLFTSYAIATFVFFIITLTFVIISAKKQKGPRNDLIVLIDSQNAKTKVIGEKDLEE